MIEKNNIGDNVALFYFAAIVKEGLKEIKDQQIKEAVLRFMFDE